MSEDARYRLRCWGARGTAPSPGRDTMRYGGNTSCLEIETPGGDAIILDAGTGLRALGRAHVGERAPRDAYLALSHRHSDHVMGMPHYAPLLRGESRLSVWCGNATGSETATLIRTLMSPPLFVDLPEMLERVSAHDFGRDSPALIGRDAVVLRRLDARHPGGAAVIALHAPTRDAPILAYAPDNELCYRESTTAMREWRTSLASQLQGVGVLVHDATYRDSEIAHHAGWGHSSAEEATRFAMECGAKALLLFHHHPDRTDDQIDVMVEACRRIAVESGSPLEIGAAFEGLEVEVPIGGRATEAEPTHTPAGVVAQGAP